MKFAVIDDSTTDSVLLTKYILAYLQTQTMEADVLVYPNGQEFLDDFTAGKFSVIFLDIYMEKMDGMSVAYQIRTVDKESLLIFVTNSDIHAIESFRVRAFYYLLKPYSMEIFEEMMNLCRNKLSKDSRYIEVKENRTVVRVFLRDILYADMDGHYIQLHTKEQIIRSRMQFTKFVDYFQSERCFIMCYRNILVNMEMIETVCDHDFLLKNGEKIPIQSDRLSKVRQHFADYLFHKLKGVETY